jgi:branched-chain amino acid transport system substrate-binding protein
MKSVKNIFQVLLASISVCIVLISTPISYAQEPKPPIKIGILYPFTGPAAYMGQRMLRGWELSLEQVDYKVDGRSIKLIVEDTKGDPSVGLTKTTKLIGQDRVHILGGVLNSSTAYAIRDIVHRREIPLIITMANAGGITRENRSPFIFRIMEPGGTGSHYMAQFLYNELNLRKAVFSASDYAYGHEHAEMFKKEFERLGGQVLFQNFAPLGTADYGPYCIKLAEFAGKADVLHFVYSGADSSRFVKTASEYGLKKKFTLSSWGAVGDGPLLAQMGAAAEGIHQISYYALALKNQFNDRFLEQERKKGGSPDLSDYLGYLGAEVVLRALKQIKGNVEAKDQFLKALREVQFECATGPFRFDPRSQNSVKNLIICKVKKVDRGFYEFQNIPIKTVPQAQDPWWLER